MQLQGQLGSSTTVKYRNTFHAVYTIGKADGLRGLQRGLPAACCWQFSNVAMRFGVYGTAKHFMDVNNSSSFKWLKSLGLGTCSGALAALVSNPFFVLKTQFQAAEKPPRLVPAFLDIGRKEGFRGYFRGLSAFGPRVMVASGVQLSTYDEVKQWLRTKRNFNDGLGCHFVASWITGLAVVAAMQPFDFAATRLASDPKRELFTGPVDCLAKTIRSEGVLAVYKGDCEGSTFKTLT